MAAEQLDALFIYSDEYRPGHSMYFTSICKYLGLAPFVVDGESDATWV